MSCLYAQFRELPLNQPVLRLPDRKTRLAVLIISFILSSVFLALIRMPFPEYRRVREIELDSDIFDLIEPAPQPRPEGDIDTRRAAELRRLDEMMKAFRFEELETNVAGMIQEMDIPDPGGLEGIMAALEDPLAGDPAIGTESFLTGDDESFNLGLDDLKSSGDLPAVARADGSGFPVSGSGEGRGGVQGGRLDGGRALGSGPGTEIPFQSFEEEDYEGRNIVDPLIQWVKDNPHPHEYAVQAFLGFESGDLTSRVRFTTSGRTLDMYLQIREKTRELSIVIVEGDDFTYLVDEGISRRSHRLAVGRVERDPDDQRIVNIFSTQRAPTPEKTRDFMSLFLSWWNEGQPVNR